MYTCPVCDFAGLRVKPYEIWPSPSGTELSPPYEDFLGLPSYEVCPRCGFEFGNDDNPGTSKPVSFAEYRVDWVSRGRPWFAQTRDAVDDREDGD